MYRAWSVQLIPGSSRWLEVKLIEYLFHRDLSAEQVKIDTRHDPFLFFGGLVFGYREEAPVLSWIAALCLPTPSIHRMRFAPRFIVPTSNISGVR